jgi:hypothetical protein
MCVHSLKGFLCNGKKEKENEKEMATGRRN